MAKDRYKYFRVEADELLEGLTQGFLDLDKGLKVEVVQRMLRFAHTFKGASRVVQRSDIADLAHDIESLLVPFRDAEDEPLPPEVIDKGLKNLRLIQAHLASLGKPHLSDTTPQPSNEAAQLGQGGEREGVNIALRDLDLTLEWTIESFTEGIALQKQLASLEELLTRFKALVEEGESGAEVDLPEFRNSIDKAFAWHRSTLERSTRLLDSLDELKGATTLMRLVPTKILTTDLEQIAREAARSVNKVVRFEARAATTHLEARVLAGLRKALVHLVQNAVAHGLEESAERKHLNKQPHGLISVLIEKRGSRLIVQCSDDGRGLDWDAIRSELIRRGKVSSEKARVLSHEQLLELLLSAAISTSDSVTGIAGRGLGLDAARHAVSTLNGKITLHSEPDRGTSAVIDVPFSLSALDALAVRSRDTSLLIPLESVVQAFRISERSEREGHLLVEGEFVPIIPLEQALECKTGFETPVRAAVVIQGAGRKAALGVEAIGTTLSVIAHAIPEHAAHKPVISGAAIFEDGSPSLILSPEEFVRTAYLLPRQQPQALEPSTLSLLVIDDSLTTRMLEQSILESAGYDVDLAVSGEDGLRKAQAKPYGIFIVDVEMPNMNGFEFIEHIRRDPKLKDTPAILVTSLSSADDKRRGEKAGANAYVVKSEFNQVELLRIIEALL